MPTKEHHHTTLLATSLCLILSLYVPDYPIHSLPIEMVVITLVCWLIPLMYGICMMQHEAVMLGTLPPALHATGWLLYREQLAPFEPWSWLASYSIGLALLAISASYKSAHATKHLAPEPTPHQCNNLAESI